MNRATRLRQRRTVESLSQQPFRAQGAVATPHPS
jgi:hypothetical protein